MMGLSTNAFSLDSRTTLCESCATPMQGPSQGGTLACPKCGKPHVLAPRDMRPVAGVGAQSQLTEVERIGKLRQDDDKPALPPEELTPLMDGGGLAPGKQQEALALWQQTRQELKNSPTSEAETRLMCLSRWLVEALGDEPDFVYLRAFFESELDVVTKPSHRQTLLCALSRSACRTKDLTAAEGWLAPCDPRPLELKSDTAVRGARALIDTLRGNWNGVLGTLGRSDTDVPISAFWQIYCGSFRANAHDRLGRVQEATAQLRTLLSSAAGRDVVGWLVKEWKLCPQSYPVALAEVQSAAAADHARRAGGNLGLVFMLIGALEPVIGLVWGGLLLGHYLGKVQILEGPPAELETLLTAITVGVITLATGAGMIAIGFVLRRKGEAARQLLLRGTSVKARVISTARTGVTVNELPQWKIDLTILPEGQPTYEASSNVMLGESAAAKLTQGLVIYVRVDPKDPANVLIETSG
jgi:predicted RNA-binding Zn-ribbon protein involved in translation (DUF1610 family)